MTFRELGQRLPQIGKLIDTQEHLAAMYDTEITDDNAEIFGFRLLGVISAAMKAGDWFDSGDADKALAQINAEEAPRG